MCTDGIKRSGWTLLKDGVELSTKIWYRESDVVLMCEKMNNLASSANAGRRIVTLQLASK